MRNLVLSMMVVIATILSLSSCGDKAVKLSPEMTEFVGMIKGSADNVTEALNKFAAADELKEHDIAMYDLKDPKVTAKTGDCYTVDFTAGITTRTYDICWTGAKISKITEKEVK